MWRIFYADDFIAIQYIEFLFMILMAYTYGTAKKKRPGYLVGNLVATNWPIEKALHAIGYNHSFIHSFILPLLCSSYTIEVYYRINLYIQEFVRVNMKYTCTL